MALDPSDQNWLVTGSSRGQLCLWDVRFRLPVNTWQYPGGAPVTAMALASAQLPRLGLRLGAAAGPALYVAGGENEVALWDVAKGQCLQVGGRRAPGRGASAALGLWGARPALLGGPAALGCDPLPFSLPGYMRAGLALAQPQLCKRAAACTRDLLA